MRLAVKSTTQNKVHGFPTKTPSSLKMSNIIDGKKMRNVTLLSSASTDKAITTDQSDPDTACDKVMKHTLSVYAGDENGILNRITGVIARRGFNIESLAVGLNDDKAMLTIVVLGSYKVLNQVIEQLNKLVNVLKVEDISKEPHVERELMLIKLNADATTRSEIMWLVSSFRAKVVDTSADTLTIEVTGDPGKMVALMMNLEKFGIKEVARTGKIAMRREKMGETGKGNGSSGGNIYPEEPFSNFQPVLNANWGVVYNDDSNGIRSHTLSILVTNVPGVLNQITTAISRRGYNIQSLAVGPSETEGLSRITTVVPGTDENIEKLVRQIQKVIDLLEVKIITHIPFAERELMLIKIAANIAARRDVLDIAHLFRAKAIDFSDHTVTLEVTGDIRKMAALQTQLEVFGICEVARTGRVALVRESGVDSTYLRGYDIPL